MRGASRALRIRAGEQKPTALVASMMFVALSTAAVAESGVTALFFDRVGADALPLMYLVQAGATLVVMFALTAILSRIRPRRVYIAWPLVLAALVLVERGVLLSDARWIYPLLWVTVAFSTLAQGIGLWGTAGAVVNVRQAKRLFPIFGAAGILGSVAGGLVTRPLATSLGAENLLLVWVVGLVSTSMLCRLALGPDGIGPSRRGSASPIEDLRRGLRLVRRSRLVGGMAAAAVLFSVLFYSLFLPFATVATERFPDAEQLAGFFGLVWAAITGAAFFVSMLLTNRLFVRLGVVATVLVLPLLYAGSFAILMFGSAFATIVVLRVLTGVWLQGVASPAWETLVNVVPEDRRDHTRAFLNGGPAQVGTAIAGVVALVGQDILSPRQLSGAGLAAAVLTIAVVLTIRRSYIDALVGALHAGRPHVFSKPTAWAGVPLRLDADAIAVLRRSMRSDDPHERRLSFELASDVRADALHSEILGGLGDPDPVIRLAAVRALDVAEAAAHAGLAAAIEDRDAGVSAAAAARILGVGRDARAGARLDLLLGSDEASIRRAAAEQLRMAPDLLAADLAEPLLGDPDGVVRAIALELVVRADPERARRSALSFLADQERVVRTAAGRALAAVGPGAVEDVLRALTDPSTREAAVEAARRLHANGESERVRDFVRTVSADAERDGRLAAAIPIDDEAEAMLREAILERGRAAARCGLWAASMLSQRSEQMHVAIECLDGASRLRAGALETIEAAGERELVLPFLPLWEPIVAREERGWLSHALEDDDPLIRRCADLVRVRREGDAMSYAPKTIPAMERLLFLRRVPLFSDLVPSDLEQVQAITEERGYADGEAIAVQGELGHEMHVVTEGVIRVVQEHDGRERELARRLAGDVVGEMSIIAGAPRIASLIADGAVRTLRIGHREFESMLRERPDVALGVMRVLASRLSEATRTPRGAGMIAPSRAEPRGASPSSGWRRRPRA